MIVERAVQLCGAAFGFVLRYDGQIISVAAHYNLDPEALRVLQTVWPMAPKPESLVGRAILERRSVHIHDVLTEPAYPYSSTQQALGYRTIVVVPFYRQREPIGAIAIYRQEVAPFSEAQIALVQTFANQAVIAIENVRMFNEIREKNRQVEEQAEQLAEWNRTLESRVAEQVAQISRISKLTRFLSPKISEVIMSGEADDPLKTRRAEITVVYVDLRGFTAFTETTDPEEVMSVLREYHAELGRAITAYDGTIEHFAGDGAMILFNAPLPVQHHEMKAVQMTLQIRDSVAALATGWKKRGYALGFGAGIAGGFATMGTIGFEERLDYSAIGTVCNLAARLCGEAKDGQILIAPRVFAKIEQDVDAVPVGDLTLKGFHRPVTTYSLKAIRTENLAQ
jgi:class 3 adenylate cyclase